jgi:methyl-CpG-binding domain protein 4
MEDVEVEPHARAKSITHVHEATQENIVMPETTAIANVPTPPPSAVSRESKEPTPPPSTVSRESKERSTDSRRTIIQVVIETPRRTPVPTTRVTRSSARTRLAPESPPPQEEQTPLIRKRKRTQSLTPAELESPYPFKARSRKDVLEDVGPEEPPTEVVVIPEVVVKPAVVTLEEAPPPTKRRRSTRNLETVSPYFPTPPLTQEVAVPVKQTRVRKNATTSPYFSGASPEKKGRVPKGISAIPWPPFTASKFGLIQEELAEKPFHLLIATVFLNKTKGSVAKPILWQFLDLYPTPEILSNASQDDIEELIRPLGLQRTRAERLIKMGKEWIANPPVADAGTVKYNYPPKNTRPFPIDGREPHGVVQKLRWEISHIPGVGAYALDSWRIFCRDRLRGVPQGVEEEWKRVVPNDKELRAYCRWRWAQEGERWEEEGDGWGADAGDNTDTSTASMDALKVAIGGLVKT